MAMSDLFERRVEAFVRTYQRTGAFDEALLAADAVVTVEQIADVLRPLIREHQGADDNDSWWVADHAHDYAQAVLALFRGGAK